MPGRRRGRAAGSQQALRITPFLIAFIIQHLVQVLEETSVQTMNIFLFILNLILSMMKSIAKKFQDLGTRAIFGKEPKVLKTNFYDLVDKNMDRKVVPMSNFKGDVLLVTNVASN